MATTFKSHELDRVLIIEEVHELSLSEARRFNAELTMAMSGLDQAIERAHRIEDGGGLPFDRDWMHRTLKKRRVCQAFEAEVKRRLQKLEELEQAPRKSAMERQQARFEALRQERLRELLREELGPGVLEDIEEEAHGIAEEQFKAWLVENGQVQVFAT